MYRAAANYRNRQLLGRGALSAERTIVVKLSRERSVGLCVAHSSALWKNGASDPDAVWHHRSGGSRNEAGIGVWQLVHESARASLQLGH